MTSPATILIVDDEIQNCRLLEALLRPEGYLTQSVASGEAALAAIAEHAPDLILLDVMMPGMNGYKVTGRLKADPATAAIPIIMVTAQADRSARLTSLNVGAEEFLTKPVDRAELWVRVRNLLRLKVLSDLLQDHNKFLEQQAGMRAAELQRFRTAMDTSADAIFFVDRNTARFIDVNTTTCTMLGYSREELFQMGPAKLTGVPPDTLGREYDALIAGQGPEALAEIQFQRKDGSRFDGEVRRHAVRSDAGWTIVGVVRDITERQHAAQQLRENQQRLEGFVTSAMDAIVTADEQRRIVLSNPAAERMFGYTASELLGQPLAMLIPEPSRAEHADHLSAFADAGVASRRTIVSRPARGLRKSGEEFPIEASLSQHEASGKRFFTTIVRDIAERN